ncbi:MAG: leucine-rich repeat domain-containing protein [Melioribacteraceae bacterium]|nr:leucine-rich repeat domain-containing protein [Melioribacteraceae bacterium]
MDNHGFKKLFDAYSDNNLNRITSKLIEIYRNNDFMQLRGIAEKISRIIQIDSDNHVKCFTKLMTIYHPDKGEYFRSQIKKHFNDKNYEELEKFTHIHLIEDIDKISTSKKTEYLEDNSEYMWEEPVDGFEYYGDNDDEQGRYYEESNVNPDDEYTDINNSEKTFYNAVKLREFGNIEIEFPPYYLEDFKDINFPDSGIETLDGIQYCRDAVVLDFTNNNLIDISDAALLKKVEEVYFGNNQIGYIDALGCLLRLRVVDLSNNGLGDISPLLNLENLEFVNLIGNNVPEEQVEALNRNNVIVLT